MPFSQQQEYLIQMVVRMFYILKQMEDFSQSMSPTEIFSIVQIIYFLIMVEWLLIPQELY